VAWLLVIGYLRGSFGLMEINGRKIKPGDNLEGANLAGANLAGANLAGANLAGANLRGADLCGADISDANLAGAYLYKATFIDANLKSANFERTILCHSNFKDAKHYSSTNLTYANLFGAVLPDGNTFVPAINLNEGAPPVAKEIRDWELSDEQRLAKFEDDYQKEEMENIAEGMENFAEDEDIEEIEDKTDYVEEDN